MRRQELSAGNLAKTAALLFFVGLVFADGVVAFFLIRDRLEINIPRKLWVYLPLVIQANPPDTPPTAYPIISSSLTSPTSQPSTVTPRPAVKTYVVKSGDTLFQIAQDNNVTVEELVSANHLNDRNVIQVGQELTIPIPTTETPAPLATSTAKP